MLGPMSGSPYFGKLPYILKPWNPINPKPQTQEKDAEVNGLPAFAQENARQVLTRLVPGLWGLGFRVQGLGFRAQGPGLGRLGVFRVCMVRRVWVTEG